MKARNMKSRAEAKNLFFGIFLFAALIFSPLTYGVAKAHPFDPELVSQLKKVTAQEVSDDPTLFIYEGFVYRMDPNDRQLRIPRFHLRVFARRKALNSTWIKQDVEFHPNLSLAEFFAKFENIVGVLDEDNQTTESLSLE